LKTRLGSLIITIPMNVIKFQISIKYFTGAGVLKPGVFGELIIATIA